MRIPNKKITRIFFKKENLPLEIRKPKMNFPEKLGFLKNEKIFLFFLLFSSIISRFFMLGTVPDMREFPALEGEVLWLSYFNVLDLINGKPLWNLSYAAHNTPLFGYLLLPFHLLFNNFLIFGVTIDILSIFLLYTLCKNLFGLRAAKISSVFYLMSAFSINLSRITTDTNILNFFLILVVTFSYKWYKYNNRASLAISMMLIGIAFSIHMSFIYSAVAFLILFLLFKKIRIKAQFKDYIIAVSFILLGIVPVLFHFYFVPDRQGEFFQDISENFPVTVWGYDNFDIFRNIIYASNDLWHSLDRPIILFLEMYGGLSYNTLIKIPSFFFVIFIFSIVYLVFKGGVKERIIVLMTLSIFFLSIFSLTKYRINFIIPFVYIIISRFFSEMSKRNVLATLVLIFIISLNLLHLIFDYYLFFEQIPNEMESRYGLKVMVDYIRDTNVSTLYVDDWRYFFVSNYYANRDFSVNYTECGEFSQEKVLELSQEDIELFQAGEIAFSAALISSGVEARVKCYGYLTEIFSNESINYSQIEFVNRDDVPINYLIIS